MGDKILVLTSQVWQRKDPRDGGVRVLVIEVDRTWVTVRNQVNRRRSRIRQERFQDDYTLVEEVS